MLTFERWKIVLVLCVVALGICYSVPNFFPQKATGTVPGWFPHKQINLGKIIIDDNNNKIIN